MVIEKVKKGAMMAISSKDKSALWPGVSAFLAQNGENQKARTSIYLNNFSFIRRSAVASKHLTNK